LQEALTHPYLADLHARSPAPACPHGAFDWSFEARYPDEMPQPLLQRHMFADMLLLRARNAAELRGPMVMPPAGVAAPAAGGGGAPADGTDAAAVAAAAAALAAATAAGWVPPQSAFGPRAAGAGAHPAAPMNS
jgi:hypothetical protein